MRLVTPLEMMKLEEFTNQSGITYEAMMEQAGIGLAAHINAIATANAQKDVLFLCGSGNNAGDCFVAARILASTFQVTLCMVGGIPRTRTAFAKYRQLPRAQLKLLDKPEVIRTAVKEAGIIIDGVFGTGFRDNLNEDLQELFALTEGKTCIAVDIPSGGSGKTGAVAPGTPHCAYTITFGACKYGLLQPPLSDYTGTIRLVDIGIPEEAFAQLDYALYRTTNEKITEWMPERTPDAHKGSFGRTLIIGGSRQMPGAAILAAHAALRSGCGTVCLASVPEACQAMLSVAPEAMLLPLPVHTDGHISPDAAVPTLLKYALNCQAVVIGNGLGQSVDVQKLVTQLLTQITCPIILDADGLNAITNSIDILQRTKAPLILTPHPGEFSRLSRFPVQDIQSDRLSAAKRFAIRYPRCITVLKGAGTITAQNATAYINPSGNTGLSKGGSGDVLAGLIGGLCAQGIEPLKAAVTGAYLHGRAGEFAAAKKSERGVLPTDVIYTLAEQMIEYE